MPDIFSAHTKKPDTFQNIFKSNNGFSLIELCITLSILSIIVTAAIPNISSFTARSKIKTASLSLQQSITLARQFAISNNQTVHLCAKHPLEENKCITERNFNADWSDGWLVFADTNNNNEFDSSDTLIRSHSNDNKTKVIFNQRGRLRFFSNGGARSAGFYLCSKHTEENRHIRLVYSGRSRVSKINNERQRLTCLSEDIKK